MDTFLESHKLPKLEQEEMENVNSPITREEIEACSGFLFLPVPVLVVCGFPGMRPFLLDCLIYWRIAVHNMFLYVNVSDSDEEKTTTPTLLQLSPLILPCPDSPTV